MNNEQINGNEDNDAVDIKQLNEMETNSFSMKFYVNSTAAHNTQAGLYVISLTDNFKGSVNRDAVSYLSSLPNDRNSYLF